MEIKLTNQGLCFSLPIPWIDIRIVLIHNCNKIYCNGNLVPVMRVLDVHYIVCNTPVCTSLTLGYSNCSVNSFVFINTAVL